MMGKANPEAGNRVFQVDIIRIENTQYKLGGRALETIDVNDVVLVHELGDKDAPYAQLQVTKIEMYGIEIDQITAAYTAWLYLEGGANNILKESDGMLEESIYPYSVPSPSSP